jgi:hypothetical protein
MLKPTVAGTRASISVLVVAVAFVALAAMPPLAAASPKQPHLVCWYPSKNNGPLVWHETVRPHSCNLRKKGAQGFYYILRNLHWTHWGRSSARGRGRWRISDAKLRIHIRLYHPKWGWGPHGVNKRYFSRAKIAGPHAGSDRFRLDVPHSRRL